MKELNLFLVAIIIGTILTVYKAFVVVQVWGWYIVSFGVPYLTMPQSIGLIIVLSLATQSYKHKNVKDPEKNMWLTFFGGLITYSLTLAIAYVLKFLF